MIGLEKDLLILKEATAMINGQHITVVQLKAQLKMPARFLAVFAKVHDIMYVRIY